MVDFSVDEHPRRDTTIEKLAALKVLHPEIEGFSSPPATAAGPTTPPPRWHSSMRDYAEAERLTVMGTVTAWASAGVAPEGYRPGRRQVDRQGVCSGPD